MDTIIDRRPTAVLAAGPPLYLGRLGSAERRSAWHNALRLIECVKVVIRDHHLMRSDEGPAWLDHRSETTGKRVFSAADFMGKPRRLLEARRRQLYRGMPVPERWHEQYARGEASIAAYFEGLPDRSAESTGDPVESEHPGG